MIKVGIVMDPIESISAKKDTTLAMMLEAQRRGWQIFYIEPQDLYLKSGNAYASSKTIEAYDDPSDWFKFTSDNKEIHLADLDVVLMRKDPPFDMDYIYLTYILDRAQENETLVLNNPTEIRSANEKLFTSWFNDLCAPTIVDCNLLRIKQFINEHKHVVAKPLDGMGGASIFSIEEEDKNLNVILETLTERGTKLTMVQKFIPEIEFGDKRIILIDGEPIPYALARIPAQNEFRGNLAAGGTGKGIELSENDKKICSIVGPVLKEKGLLFVGIDVIGNYLTEINVTSPTCVRELDREFNLNICATYLDKIEEMLNG